MGNTAVMIRALPNSDVSTEADDAIISSAHDGWFVDLNPGDADSEPEDFVAGIALAKDI